MFDNNFVAMQATQAKHIKIVKKRGTGDLQDVNDFLWRPIGKYFEWNITHGWVYNMKRYLRVTVR